jgi:hypothetical protein
MLELSTMTGNALRRHQDEGTGRQSLFPRPVLMLTPIGRQCIIGTFGTIKQWMNQGALQKHGRRAKLCEIMAFACPVTYTIVSVTTARNSKFD